MATSAVPLSIGDPAPWATLPSTAHPQHYGDYLNGDRTVLFFLGSASSPETSAALMEFVSLQAQLQALGASVLGVSIDPQDQALSELVGRSPHLDLLWDFDGQLSALYGVCQIDSSGGIAYDPTTFVLDENLRIVAIIPLDRQVSHGAMVMEQLSQLPPISPPTLVTGQAPVLLVPRVLELAFCQLLMDRYESEGSVDSGFMQQVGDQTVEVLNPAVKQRRDLRITDPSLIGQINQRIWRRIVPEIEKAFYYRVTNFERYLVGCYDDQAQGFFKPHRDNANVGSLHRRFAMTLNLNEGYEGGYLRFPEYGSQLYRPAPGEAVIFSCSLLHEATPVTQGRRFTLLSFFYNQDDAKLREANKQHVVLRSPTVGDAQAASASNKPTGFGTINPRKKR
ncbi:redoxin domain-containing protein [Thermoleptolyngbya sp. C42_A2020_037]|uniref:redoxin domain-containing protein n=1 Tax=Thermoleptolyngbya sp. C42_A2020_037 TaxID=2747799 RepID=UPI001A0CBFF4|nr:redoxin domain-containing protein [Thermoleptolyngbya sp. C42_A2020_037]MBF2085725.1 redoxin domain-containing protein [Thermoleptolyngbya sp. C42_A2020_037]